MLSLEQLRAIDPELKDISDERLLEIRDCLYELGNIIFDDWLEEKKKINGNGTDSLASGEN